MIYLDPTADPLICKVVLAEPLDLARRPHSIQHRQQPQRQVDPRVHGRASCASFTRSDRRVKFAQVQPIHIRPHRSRLMILGEHRLQIHRHQTHLRPIRFDPPRRRFFLPFAHDPMVRAYRVFHSMRDFFTPSEAAGGAQPKAETPEDGEGSQTSQAALESTRFQLGLRIWRSFAVLRRVALRARRLRRFRMTATPS
jgi:hypothetical protein